VPIAVLGRKLPKMPDERDTLTSEELARVLSNYDLGIVQGVSAFARGSHAAAKLVVRTERGKFLIKRRPVGKYDAYRVAFAHALQRYLASKNFPLPHLIGTRDQNNSMLKLGEAIYEVFEFIDGEAYNGGLVATYEAGKTLGLYHRLVSQYHPEYEPPRGHYHDARMVYAAFKPVAEALSKRPSAKGRLTQLIDLIKALKRAYKRAAAAVNELGMEKWEVQIVHSDWHPGNMLFDREHIVAVIDYDTARIRPRVMDVANGCLQFSMVTGGRDLTSWEDRTDDLRARRFLRGYDELITLSKAELQAVPHLMQEVLVAQALQPILRTGTFAGLDGFAFLEIVLAKVNWLRKNTAFTTLDAPEDKKGN
jgi:Ser/Thr protein kinase RdoA (MazF antagonist)